MLKFSENYKEFVGDGSVDENGRTLEEFLTEYDPYKYKTPAVTADIVVLKEKNDADIEINNTGLQLLLIKRKNHPCINEWALPGGFAELDESLEESAKRELEEETTVTGVPMQQLRTWGEPDRDPRGRVITVSYLAYLEQEVDVVASDDAKEAAWVDVRLNLIQTIRAGQAVTKKYYLELYSKERSMTLSAAVSVTRETRGITRQDTYTLHASNGIAFDHAKIILDALLSC
ncbi:MAG: NUDIX hydrolase [bacterium]|nr:NUDIX hydrolase [bacterium]